MSHPPVKGGLKLVDSVVLPQPSANDEPVPETVDAPPPEPLMPGPTAHERQKQAREKQLIETKRLAAQVKRMRGRHTT